MKDFFKSVFNAKVSFLTASALVGGSSVLMLVACLGLASLNGVVEPQVNWPVSHSNAKVLGESIVTASSSSLVTGSSTITPVILPPPPIRIVSVATISAAPQSLAFSSQVGAITSSQNLVFSNNSASSVSFSITVPSNSWLKYSGQTVGSISSNSRITVSVFANGQNLQAGSYSGNIILSYMGKIVTVPVYYVVANPVGTVNIALDASTPAVQTVNQNATGVILGDFKISNSWSARISINKIVLNASQPTLSNLKNIYIYSFPNKNFLTSILPSSADPSGNLTVNLVTPIIFNGASADNIIEVRGDLNPGVTGMNMCMTGLSYNFTDLAGSGPVSGGACANPITVAAPSNLQIVTTNLPDATIDQAYSAQLEASGGTSPYKWTSLSTTYPSYCCVLGVNENGLFNTQASATVIGPAGSYNWQIKVTDAVGNSTIKTVSLEIRPASSSTPLIITNLGLNGASVGQPYAVQMQSLGGTAPYSWTLASSTYPYKDVSLSSGGLLSTGSGVVSGQSGTYSLSFQVKDSVGHTANKTLNFYIAPGVKITLDSSTPAAGVKGPGTQQSLMAIKISALSQEATISQINFDYGQAGQYLSNLSLVDSGTVLQNIASLPSGGTYVGFSNFPTIKIPANTSKVLTIRADVSSGSFTLQPKITEVWTLSPVATLLSSQTLLGNILTFTATASSGPVIKGVAGPGSLNVGQVGTWAVSATDPNNGSLSYSVDWGDNSLAGSAPVPQAVQTATFTHSYSTAGNYTIKFTVSNNVGQKAQASLTVNVVAPFAAASLSKNLAYSNQNVSANTSRVKIGSYLITASSAEALKVNSLTVGLSGSLGLSNLANLYLVTPQGNTVPVVPTSGKFNVAFTVPAGASSEVDVYADIGNAGGTIITSLQGTGVGVASNVNVLLLSVSGQTITVDPVSSATLKATLDASTPTSQFVIGNSSNQLIAIYNLVSPNGSAVVQELDFTASSSLAITSVFVNGVGVAVVNGKAILYGLNISVPSGIAGVTIPVKVNYAPVGLNGVPSNQLVQLVLTGVKYLSGTSSQSSAGILSVPSNIMDLVGSYPTVSLSGVNTAMVVGNNIIGKITAAANTAGDIYLSNLPLTFSTSSGTLMSKTITLIDDVSKQVVASTTMINNDATLTLINGGQIPAGTSRTYDISVQVTSVQPGSSLSVKLGSASGLLFKDIIGNLYVYGGDMMRTFIPNYPTNSVSIIASGSPTVTLKAGLDASTPLSSFVLGNNSNQLQLMAVYNLASANSSATVQEMDFTVSSSASITSVCINSNCSAVPSGGNVSIYGLNITVPSGAAGVTVPVKVVYAPVGPNGAPSNQLVNLTLTGVKYLAGTTSQSLTGLSIPSNTMDVVGSYPSLSLAAGNNPLSIGNALAGRVTISANAAGDVVVTSLPINANIVGGTINTGTPATLVDESIGTTAGSGNFYNSTGGILKFSLNTDNRILAGSSKTYDVYIPVKSFTGGTNFPTLSVSLGNANNFVFNDIVGGVNGVTGGKSDWVFIPNYPTNTVTISGTASTTSGLIASLDASTPLSSKVTAGSTGVPFTVFNLAATSSDLQIKTLIISTNLENTADFSKIYIYQGINGQLLGTIDGNSIRGSQFSNASVNFTLPKGNMGMEFYITADLSPTATGAPALGLMGVGYATGVITQQTQWFNIMGYPMTITATAPSSHAIGNNVSAADGTVYFLASDGTKRPYISAAAFTSYGFNSWSNIVPASSADLALPTGSLIWPMSGSLFVDRDQIVYIVNQNTKKGFSSMQVFSGLDYSLGNVVSADLSSYLSGPSIDSDMVAHPVGTVVNFLGAIYIIGPNGLVGFPDMATFNSWGYKISQVVIGNKFDKLLPSVGAVNLRQPGQLSPF